MKDSFSLWKHYVVGECAAKSIVGIAFWASLSKNSEIYKALFPSQDEELNQGGVPINKNTSLIDVNAIETQIAQIASKVVGSNKYYGIRQSKDT